MVRNLKNNKNLISKIGLFHDPEEIRGALHQQIFLKGYPKTDFKGLE